MRINSQYVRLMSQFPHDRYHVIEDIHRITIFNSNTIGLHNLEILQFKVQIMKSYETLLGGSHFIARGVRVFLEKKYCTLIFEEKKNCTLIFKKN